MRHSSRAEVDPFIVMDVMEAARAAEEAGRHIIHMEVGQPGTGAPLAARARLAAEMDAGPLGYTVALGRPDLRAGIAALYDKWYGLDLDPARVVVTAGASGAFLLAFSALFDAGEKVALGEPCYPSYRQILRALSLEPVGLQTDLASRYQPLPAQLTDDLAGLVVASPANPTGTMLDADAIRELSEACTARDIALISDEIYHGLQYEGPAVSALEITDQVYVLNSFSKYFSMTGWRLGWMVVPPDHVRLIERLAQNMFICPPHAAQVAALGALSPEGRAELDGHRAVYAANRALMLDGLAKAGFTKTAPADGAFYVYADVSDWTNDSRAFCAEMLEQAGVAVTPGLDFDPHRGHQTLRFSYARSTGDIEESIARLQAFMAARRA
ncbi:MULTISPECIES: aminotransferase class I/II-fold pyridoxal phosphate-dependent enzyme [unclassified Roseobacter]|uniref:aminotransferase class I/II-fold pyridoxal phosphate-dependent enzyme n=1 Tax=unclassified Roseobacter TaxID=196798 RepID=UPI001493096D|nr:MULTISPECIES: aminotransferase class I/II-fold pyridoxal phosphate-dependent enzyme [unclassified Roseobacter]NNV26110.1 aminotransferase class I/II-fold pyridoxal phosphate-dependent enzyme [Roseobacter sp. HKCCD8192]NNV60169.1 aminotransferase class I/II-fold pyridoxal phosphate-dependent enzyme [Roseobacter sp. HKCCD8861]NNV78513.1 aminotransferase class I/II-fold pyridoxal phosphate-dependent enzyme [Roseobacter sp. HKCCD6135]NNV95607.1 aminotransferase class I/II-fold pyridoxal phosphat